MTETIGEILERIAYIGAYAPDFPSEDETVLEVELEVLIQGLHQHLGISRKRWKKQLLIVATEEIQEARPFLVKRDQTSQLRASSLLQAAAEHIRQSQRAKAPRTTFVVSPGGTVRPSSGDDGER